MLYEKPPNTLWLKYILSQYFYFSIQLKIHMYIKANRGDIHTYGIYKSNYKPSYIHVPRLFTDSTTKEAAATKQLEQCWGSCSGDHDEHVRGNAGAQCARRGALQRRLRKVRSHMNTLCKNNKNQKKAQTKSKSFEILLGSLKASMRTICSNGCQIRILRASARRCNGFASRTRCSIKSHGSRTTASIHICSTGLWSGICSLPHWPGRKLHFPRVALR